MEDRNNDGLVLHATFTAGDKHTKLFLASDTGHEILTDIVTVTESKNNGSRLEWDIFKLPHHCSHHSLSGEEREGDKSIPEPKVARLFEDYSQDGVIVVSTPHPIHRRLRSEELVRLRRACEHRRYAASQRRSRIDPNPHQINAVIFALERIQKAAASSRTKWASAKRSKPALSSLSYSLKAGNESS